jgi:hypothetical protein
MAIPSAENVKIFFSSAGAGVASVVEEIISISGVIYGNICMKIMWQKAILWR